MHRIIRSGSGLVVALALVGLVVPLQTMAATVSLDRQIEPMQVLRQFSSGARLLTSLPADFGRELANPLRLAPGVRHDEHMVFEASNGERLHVYLDALSDRAVATVNDAFSIEIVKPVTQGVVPVFLVVDGQRIDISDPETLKDPTKLAALEAFGQRFGDLLSPTMERDLNDAGQQLATASDLVGLDPGDGGGDALISRGAIECGLATVSYLGSIITLGACVTIFLCAVAIALHYVAIAGAAYACVGWAEERAAERIAACEDGDPDTPCELH